MRTFPLLLPLTAALAACVSEDPADLESVDDELLGLVNCAMKNNEAGGYDTGLPFSSFWSASSGFTLSAWIMPEFIYADEQPVFGAAGSAFWVGGGDFNARARNTIGCDDEQPVLRVHAGGQTIEYLAPTLARGTWHHLAMTWGPHRTGAATVRLYLDGVELSPQHDESTAPDPEDRTCANTSDVVDPALVLTSGTAAPPGTLQIGVGDGRYFYGLIDSALVQNAMLTPAEVATLADGGSPTSRSVVWSTEFTPAAASCTGSIGSGSAQRVGIGIRDATDAKLLTQPSLIAPSGTTYHLPWATGEIWRVIQGVDSRGSHNGGAAFSYDFGKIGGSGGAIVRAASAGELVHVYETHNPPSSKLDENKIWIETPSGEITTHLHLQIGSVTEVFFDDDPPLFLPQDWNFTVPVGDEDEVARVGYGNAAHLHFSVRPPGSTGPTMPVAFSSYQVAVDCATGAPLTADTPNIASHGCWRNVSRGIPTSGTYLRRQ